MCEAFSSHGGSVVTMAFNTKLVMTTGYWMIWGPLLNPIHIPLKCIIHNYSIHTPCI